MILYPSLEELEKKIGVRFSVVMAVAKRARMLTDGSRTFFKGSETNTLSIATHELDRGNVVLVPRGEGYIELPKAGSTDTE
jgi:DNA-directed RNA polymerase omega subunit